MNEVRPCVDEQEWDEFVLSRGGHPLQLWGWGELKASHGWESVRLLAMSQGQVVGGAQVLIRRLPWPLKSLAYIPRGPVVAKTSQRSSVLDSLSDYVKREIGSVVLTIEPDWSGSEGLERWRRSDNTILIPRTLILDLNKSDDELLAAMTKKTRQYIRKSAKAGLDIRQVKSADDIAKCLEIYKQTAERAGFAIHGDAYYQDVASKLGEHSLVMAAYSGDQPVAFLWLAISGAVAFELYGGMNDEGQVKRANFTLKWETILLAKRWGVERYDMNGLLNDGVSKFKQGFADHEDMLAGTYDKPLSVWYPLWDKGLPAAKKVIRAIKR